MAKEPWRLLITPPAHGAWNMAVDEAILEEVSRGNSLPTLRLYAWEPPCLSIGYAQPISNVDLVRLRAYDWELVRRPTGGRAVLHTDELTYSVIAPSKEPLVAGTLLEPCGHVCVPIAGNVDLTAGGVRFGLSVVAKLQE